MSRPRDLSSNQELISYMESKKFHDQSVKSSIHAPEIKITISHNDTFWNHQFNQHFKRIKLIK